MDKLLTIEMPPGYTSGELKNAIRKKSGSADPFRIIRKSLDCRRKNRIRWILQISFQNGPVREEQAHVPIPRFPSVKKSEPVIVVGSGPAGIFSAIVMAEAGLNVTLLERGHPIEKRRESLEAFEQGGPFDPAGNYSFGEGGAGAFSDGKLTSRSKHISAERAYVHDAFIKAGAPEEIAYLAHPHVGSDILFTVTGRLRKRFIEAGGTVLFDTAVTGFTRSKHWVVDTDRGTFDAAAVIAAPGHSARDTLAMMIRSGIPFRSKPFALGLRAEHRQELINQAQWGKPSLPGVKAAEYRLTAPGGVYSFCMCPGGRVIPAAPFEDVNIVNGMSLYARDGEMANAAVVASFNAETDWGREASPMEVLEWLTDLEKRFKASFGFRAPAVSIADFQAGKASGALPETTSYPLGLTPFDPWDYLPKSLLPRLRDGLETFCRKLNGYGSGYLLGLESKTSSPVQALREDDGQSPDCPGFYVAGEASGRAGGIVSSAADGIKSAVSILRRFG